MADYKIQIGTELDTKGIDQKVKNYNGNVEVGSTLDTSGITKVLNAYKPKPLNVNTKLSTKGITEAIKNYKAKKDIKVKIDPDFTGVNTAIETYQAKPLGVKVELNWVGVVGQIKNFQTEEKVRLNAELNDEAISDSIKTFNTANKATKIKIGVDPDFDGINKKIGSYTPRTLMKINAKVNKSQIDKSIKDFKTSSYVKVGVQLKEGAIETAVGKYAQKEVVPVAVDFKVGGTQDIDAKITSYKNTPVDVPVRLMPAKTGFSDKITNTPVKVSATVDKDDIRNDIETAVGGYAPTAKMPVNIKLTMPKDINSQVKGLGKPTEPIDVDVKLNESNINADIALFKPTATLGIQPDLIIENVDDQIRAYVPKEKIKVHLDLIDNDINTETGKQNAQAPITVNVKLDHDGINKQIEGLKPSAKVKVGVQLDFASHKDKDTKEYIQKGISKQIKDYQTKTKVKVGVELDRDSIIQEIGQINVDTTIRLGVELDHNGVQNVRSQIDDLRKQLEAIGNVSINLNGNVGTKIDNDSGSIGESISNVQNGLKQVTTTADNTADAIRNMREKLSNINIDRSSIDKVATDMENMGVAIKEVTAELKGSNLDITVSGIDSVNESFRVIRRLNTETKEITQLGARIKQSFSTTDEFVRDVNKEMDNFIRMQNEINQKKINIQTVKTQGGDLEYIKTLERQLKDLETTYSELMHTFMKKLTINADIIPNDDINRFEDAITALNQGADFKIGKIVDKSDANIIKEINNDMTNLKNLKKEIGNTKIEIQSLRTNDGDVEYISLLETRLNSLERTYISSKNALKDKLTINADKVAMDDVKDFLNDIAILDKKADIKVGQIVDKSNANTIKEINKEMASFVKLQSQIANMKTKIGGLEIAGGKSNQVAELKAQLEGLEDTYDSLMRTFMNKLQINADIMPMEDVVKFDNEIAAAVEKAENKFRELDAKYADTRSKLASEIKLKFDNGDFNVLSKINLEVQKLKGDYPELTSKIKDAKVAISNMEAAIGTGDEVAEVEKLISAYNEFHNALQKIKNQLDLTKAAEKDAADVQKLNDDIVLFQNKIDAYLTKNSAAANEFGSKLLDLRAKAQGCDRVTLNHLEAEFKQVDKAVEAAGKKTQTFGDSLRAQIKRYSSYLSVASVIMYASQAMRSMFEQVKLIDSAMTELKKVTNETDASYNNFLNNAASRAKELGTTIDGLVASTADFARLGYGFKESQQLAEVANIYAVVGDEIEGVEDATQSLVSTMAAFKGEMNGMSDGDFAMGIVDKMNEVSNNFAISSGGIGEALQRSASSMAAANNTLDETIAMITAANEVAQNPEKVGNAMKTMSMRIRGAKTELEDAGESTDGMAESTASLRQEMLALSGVDIMLNENTFKSTYQIMDELSKKWENLSDIAQATIIELVAGKHQGNVFASLMANFQTARDALTTSLGSSGSAMAEHAKWSESLEARLNKLKAAWQSFAQTFMDSSLLKGGIDAIKGLVEALDWLLDNFGLLGTIGLGAGITGIFKYFKGAKEAKKTITDVVKAVDNLTDVMSNATNAATEAAEATSNVANASTEVAEAAGNIASATTEAAEATTNLTSASTETTEASANLASTATEVSEAAANMASTTTEAVEAAGNLASTSTEAAEAIANTASAATEAAEAITNMTSAGAEAAETGTNLASGVSEFVEAAGNTASIATETTETVVNLGGAAVEAGAGAAKAAGGFSKFFGTLGGKLAIAGAVVAVIGLIYSQYKKAKEAAAELRQETIETSNEYLEAASSFEKAYIKYSGRTDLTTSEEAELKSAIQGTVDALGDKSSALQSIVNNSNDYLASLEAIKKAELEAAEAAAEDKRDAAEGNLREAAIGWESWDGSEVNIELGNYTVDSPEKKAIEIAEEMGSEFFSSYEAGVTGGRGHKQNINEFRLSGEASTEEIIKYYNDLKDYQQQLKNAGLESTDIYTKVDDAINKMADSIALYTDGVYQAVKASYQLDNGIPKTVEKYIAMREAILTDSQLDSYSVDQKMAILNDLDSEYSKLFDLSSAEYQARKFIGIIDGYSDGTKDGTDEIGTVETFLNMRTAVNNNECTVGQYLSELDNVASMSEKFSDEEKKQFNLAFGLDTDAIKEQYKNVYNYLSRNYLNKDTRNMDRDEEYYYKLDVREYQKQIKEFLNGLSASELAAVVDIKTEIDWENTSVEDIRKQIEEQVKLNEALNFEANIEVDTTALETLNEILAESASAIGLSTESIEALKSKYSDLDGYDPATLFERTANGVKVNREELEKLENKQNDLTKSKVQEHLDTLIDKYNDVTAEIDKCTNAGERAELLSEREGYASKIEELATYQAQLEGVTGAYQDWIDAQNTPEDYEGYESVATSREDIQDEIDRGFIGNKSKKYIGLLSGEDLDGKSVDDYADAWEKLDDKVTGAGYSINDFFTVNDDGDITSKGIDRFFKSLQTDFEGSVAKFDDKTKKWSYDFGAENLEKIQKKWGIGIEAIELLLKAAASAGYDIDWDGILDGIDFDTSNFETLVSTAEAAQTAFNKLEGVEDVDFNFTATGVKEATSELEKARSTYIDLITNDDGSINLEAKGAAEMRVILATLLIQKQQLEDSNIAINIDTSGLNESQQDIANAINAVKTFREKYKNLEIAVTTGQGIEQAKTELNTAMTELQGLGDAGVDIAAELILGEGATAESLNSKVDAAISAVGSKDIKVGCELDETALGTLNSQVLANFTPEATVKITGIDDSLVNQYTSTEKTANGTVKWKNDESLVVQFQDKTHKASGIVDWANNVEKVKTKFSAAGTVSWTSGNNVKVKVVSEASGTANADGTTKNSGRAFARGNWGIGGNGVALGGELGQELVVRDGKFFTIGDTGAEFFRYKKNDIIFNAAQTESLFKYGGIKGAKPRGKMLATGSAFAEGGYPSSGRAFPWSATASESNFVTNRVTGQSYGSKDSDSSDKDKDFEEVLDWIEVIIARVERSIDKFDQQANNIYKSWSSRNKALQSQISEVNKEIGLQQKAYDKYISAANGVGLSSSWATKVRNGEINVDTIKDETLADKIKSYQDYYEKALDCKDAIEELKETEASLYAQRFENIQTQYDGILQGYEHTEAMLNEYISQAEERGYIVSKKYYDALIANEKSNIAELKKEQADLIAERDNAVESGTITRYSEEWYNMCAEIDSVTQAIEEGETSLLSYARAIEEINWSIFDLMQERISAVTEEADFLIELMSNKKLFGDDGKLTSQGLATMALHSQNYNTNMYQADEYGAEIAKLDKQIANDPYDQELINRRNELLKLQRESILAAEDEKNAIRDMVEEGINLELDALQERIDKYNESIDAAKELYDYQKDVQKQSEKIASLEKQRAAYLGNDSEEGKAKLQEIEVSLKEAKEDLQETEYDKYISDQQALLDTLYNEYELVLNTRLDNIDYLLESVIESINAAASADGTIATSLGSEGAIAIAVGNNATSIKDTLVSETNKVGTTLSNSMNSIWNSGEGNAKSVLTMYGEDFRMKSTTIITTLNGIKSSVSTMVSSLNKEAEKKTTANKTTTSAKKDPTKTTTVKKTTTTTKKSTGGDGKPKIGDRVTFVSGQYYYDSQGKKPLGSQYKGKQVYITNINTKDWATHGYHISTGKKLGQGDLGWLKLNQLSGYAVGKHNFLDDEIAWTQEGKKQEYIIRPSDGAILTPIAKGDSVLTSAASNNIWDMANSPAEFIRDNLGIGSANVPSAQNVNNNITQNFENITFSMPNVHGYNDLLTEMQRDPKFEKLVLSMTIDRIAGRSSLAKGKSIR